MGDNRDKKRTADMTKASGMDHVDSTSPRPAGMKENEQNLAKYSILFPLFIAGIFFLIEVNATYRASPEQFNLNLLLLLANGYFDSTLISSACFALLQQYFLFIPAGLEQKKGTSLFLSFLVYSFVYVAYLASSKPAYAHPLLLIIGIMFFSVMWKSLEINTRKIDAGSFSGHK